MPGSQLFVSASSPTTISPPSTGSPVSETSTTAPSSPSPPPPSEPQAAVAISRPTMPAETTARPGRSHRLPGCEELRMSTPRRRSSAGRPGVRAAAPPAVRALRAAGKCPPSQ
ncbi:hypothetical protein DQ239_00545 [Blastococcus sp. TF02-09]|nr:hypothetical protein DQ239_00545 [Blastococcus sp. TF02-9]